MAETKESRHLRIEYDFHDRYEIALAAPFMPNDVTSDEIALFDDIAKVVSDTGRTIFLPHRHLDLSWADNKIYNVMADIVMATCEQVLWYAARPSLDAEMMMAKMVLNKMMFGKDKDLVALKKDTEEITYDPLIYHACKDKILFNNNEDLLEKLRRHFR